MQEQRQFGKEIDVFFAGSICQAQKDVNDLAERPDNDTMLRLYALYKQAAQGDATGERPSSFDFVRLAKFDAGSKMEGTSTEDAMQQYIDLVASLRR